MPSVISMRRTSVVGPCVRSVGLVGSVQRQADDVYDFQRWALFFRTAAEEGAFEVVDGGSEAHSCGRMAVVYSQAGRFMARDGG